MLDSIMSFLFGRTAILTALFLAVGIDASVQTCVTAGEPLVLELRAEYEDVIRQEITVIEGQEFRVVTRRDKGPRWRIWGTLKDVVNGTVGVEVKVECEYEVGELQTSGRNYDALKINEFKGGGGGSLGAPSIIISDLWIRRGEDAIPILADALSRRDSSIAAAYRLMQLGPEAADAIPQLIKVLEEPDYLRGGRKYNSRRRHVARALGEIAGAESEQSKAALSKAMHDPNGFVAVAAAQALWGLSKDKLAIQVLVDQLGDLERRIRRQAAFVLGEIGPAAAEAEAIHALTEALSDAHPSVRRQAATTLGKIGQKAKSSIPKISELLQDDEAPVRKAAASALEKLREFEPVDRR